MRRLLRGCEVVSFDEADAHAAGALLGKTRTKDVVDASVVVLSIRYGADVISDDPEDIRRLYRSRARPPPSWGCEDASTRPCTFGFGARQRRSRSQGQNWTGASRLRPLRMGLYFLGFAQVQAAAKLTPVSVYSLMKTGLPSST